MKLQIFKQKRYASAVKKLARNYLVKSGISSELTDTIILCIEELLSNIISHSSVKTQNNFINMNFSISDSIIILNIETEDAEFNIPELFDSDSFKRRFKGGGLQIIKNLTADFRYSHIDNKNIFSLTFDKL